MQMITPSIKASQKETIQQEFAQVIQKQTIQGQSNLQEQNQEEDTVNLSNIASSFLLKMMKKNEMKQNKFVQDQLFSLNFLSLRERFGATYSNYALPKKFTALLDRMKTIEWNLWKKRQLIIDPSKFLIDFIYLRQLLSISTMYILTKKQNKFELKFPKSVVENLGPFKEGPLPQILQNRIQTLNNQLNRIVQIKHQKFMEQIQDFTFQQNQFKVYHPDFDIESIEDIDLIPVEWTFNIEEKQEFEDLVLNIWKYSEARGVNFVFFDNLVNQIKIRTSDQSREEIERKIQFLFKLLPDCLQISNQKNESDRAKWIVQMNKKFSGEEIQQRIAKLLN